MRKKKTTSSVKPLKASKKKISTSLKHTQRPLGEDVKYNLTFLINTTFKGVIYEKGDTISVEPHEFEAYKGRPAYQFGRA